MASTIKIKRSSVVGRFPNTSIISAGELALNTADQKLYSSDGVSVFTIGSQQTNLVVNGNTSISKLLANGSLGTSGYVLKTNGSTVYWSTDVSGGATWSALTSTNTALRTLISDRIQVANAVAIGATKASWSALTGTNTALRTLISDRLQVANAVATYQTKTVERAALANTNLRINLINTNLTNTNTAVRTLINDRIQVANAAAQFSSWAALTGTNTAIRALVSDRYQVANVNTNFLKKSGTVPQVVNPNVSFSSNVAIQGNLTVYGGITTYTANNLSIGDNLILLNSTSTVSNPDLGIAANYNDGTYRHAGVFRDASDAGTWKVFEKYVPEPDASEFIDTAHATFKLAPFSARDARFTGVLSVTANTSVGNTTVGGFLKLDGTDIRATFAQNTYVKTTLANTNLRVNLINTNLTGTNTALRALINDRIQVANAVSIGAGKATWTALTGTNTAIRALVSDRLQVANAATLYTTKSNPTTSGLLAHTGRATISTNIAVTGNTTITGALINLNNTVTVTTNAGTVSTSYRVSTFTNSSAATMTITMSTTGAIDGQMIMVRIYDFSAAAQTIAWVNTENSIVTAPTTSNGSTTLPLTVGFMYNGQTSKWRCIASA